MIHYMPELVIATPVRGGEPMSAPVSFGWAAHMRGLCVELGVDVPIVGYSSDVVRARNRLAAQILRERPDTQYVLWWDSDTWPENRAIVREMMALGVDVVSAPHTNKRPPLRWLHQHLKPRPDPVGELQEVRAVPFGFTMTSVACLRAMSEVGRKYTDHPNPHVMADIFGLRYEAPIEGGPPENDTLLSEDYSFCSRWRQMGGRVHIYLGAGVLAHDGQHSFSAREMPGAVT